MRKWVVYTEAGGQDVVSIDTSGQSGAIEGLDRYEFDASLFTMGMDSTYYKVVSSALVVLDSSQIQIDGSAKSKWYAQKRADLLAHRKFLNNEAPFMYDGKKYVNDEPNLQGVKVQVLDKPDSDPIPTFIGTPMAGTWKTYDEEYVPYTNLEFRTGLAEAYFQMRTHNYTNYGILKSQLDGLLSDPTKTVDDILNFDIKVGWSSASVVE